MARFFDPLPSCRLEQSEMTALSRKVTGFCNILLLSIVCSQQDFASHFIRVFLSWVMLQAHSACCNTSPRSPVIARATRQHRVIPGSILRMLLSSGLCIGVYQPPDLKDLIYSIPCTSPTERHLSFQIWFASLL